MRDQKKCKVRVRIFFPCSYHYQFKCYCYLPYMVLRGLTSFDVDILTPNLARGVLGSAVVRVVMNQLAEAGWQEVEDLEGSIWVDMADAWDIVDLLTSRQIPAQRGRRGAPSRTGH